MAAKGKLLVVGADRMARALLANFLEGLGYEVRSASDVLVMLGLLEADLPDLVLHQRLDASEPSVAAALGETSVDLPLIVLTPSGDDGEAARRPEVVTITWPAPRPEIAAVVENVVQSQRAARLSRLSLLADRDTMPAPSTEGASSAPRMIGRYRIDALIGRGGMGDVYRCVDVQEQRRVAVKTIRCGVGPGLEDESATERFRIEAAALARLVHPNIVATHDFGIDEQRGEMYLVMEYVDGPSLRHRLDQSEGRGLPLAEALRITWDMADALAHAHERGVVHRDVKPENVLITDLGEPMLTDFGLARVGNFSVSDGQVIAGTPDYMAPEQILTPREVDARTDQFGLGAMLHEMLTGNNALPPSGGASTILGTLGVVRPALAEVGVDAPEPLQNLLDRMLQQEPASRFPDDEALLQALASLGNQLGIVCERSV